MLANKKLYYFSDNKVNSCTASVTLPIKTGINMYELTETDYLIKNLDTIFLRSNIYPKEFVIENCNNNAVKLKNPLSREFEYLRNDLISGLLKAVSYNLNRNKNYFKMFEIGSIQIETSQENRTIPVYASKDVKKVNIFKSLFMSFNYMIWGDV